LLEKRGESWVKGIDSTSIPMHVELEHVKTHPQLPKIDYPKVEAFLQHA
jgi:hypothetical protein